MDELWHAVVSLHDACRVWKRDTDSLTRYVERLQQENTQLRLRLQEISTRVETPKAEPSLYLVTPNPTGRHMNRNTRVDRQRRGKPHCDKFPM